jgi:hypothetical protein
MFSNWAMPLSRLRWVLMLAAAVIAVVPFGSAHHESGAYQGKITVDDVLDDPQHYVRQELTLEGEIDHIYSSTTFAMEDDQDLIGDGSDPDHFHYANRGPLRRPDFR